MESLELRRLLTTFTATNATGLVSDIVTANGDPTTPYTIKLTASNYTFSNSYNETPSPNDGPDALPEITGNITIVGNGATIERASNASSPFRLFDCSSD